MTAYQSLHVENFKGIRKMDLEGLGMVNVFVGANTVGKTSVLDAMAIVINSYPLGTSEKDTYPDLPQAGVGIENGRPFIPSYRSATEFSLGVFGQAKSCKETDVARKVNADEWASGFIELKQQQKKEDVDGLRCDFYVNRDLFNNAKTTKFRVSQLFSSDNEIKSESRYFELVNFPERKLPINNKVVFRNYISTDINFIKQLSLDYFEKVRFKSKYYDETLQTLKKIDAKLIDVIYGTNNQLQALHYTEDKTDTYDLSISLMGEGFIRLLGLASIIPEIKDSFLLVDEIENGFHYSVQKDMWRMVLTAARDHGTQFFFTTHSYEILESLNEVAKEFEQTKTTEDGQALDMACVFELEKDESDTVTATRYNQSALDGAMIMNMEIRGAEPDA